MKTFLLLLLAFGLHSFALRAQTYAPPLPPFRDTVLTSVIKKNYYYFKRKDNKYYRNNTSFTAFRDTIMPIFSQFAVGNNAYSKNVNVLTAEVASKETRFSYNAAAYSEKGRGIYNVELFAIGKDNLASVFGKAKFKGAFGINVSSSYLVRTAMLFYSLEADTLYNNRSLYAWTLENKAKEVTEEGQKKLVSNEISRLEALITDTTFTEFPSRDVIYSRIIKMKDSLKTFRPPSEKAAFYEEQLTSYDRKFAKWRGFNMLSIDPKLGIASEGYNYYQIIDQPVNYPVISENGKRFTRWSLGVAGNLIHNGKIFSSKTSVGASLANFIGFDGESADEISQSTEYDSLNVSRSIEKKYSAYQLKDQMLDTYRGIVLSVNHQMLFGTNKLFGFGFSCSRSDFFNGQYKGKVGIDNTYSLLIALSKKGDVSNKNVLAINFKTPDIRSELPKSLDNKTGAKLRARDKLEIGVTFGLSLEKLVGNSIKK